MCERAVSWDEDDYNNAGNDTIMTATQANKSQTTVIQIEYIIYLAGRLVDRRDHGYPATCQISQGGD